MYKTLRILAIENESHYHKMHYKQPAIYGFAVIYSGGTIAITKIMVYYWHFDNSNNNNIVVTR